MVSAKNIRICVIVIILGSFTLQPLFGQRWKLRRYEVGGGVGMTQVFGDIGGTLESENWFGLRDIKLDETSMVFPLYARYKIDPVYQMKLNLALGFGHGDDAESRNDRGRNYKTMLTEFSIQGEYYFISEEKRFRSAAMFNRRGMVNNYMTLSAYGFLGIGGVYARADVFIPQYEQPVLVDETKSSSFGMVIPFGIGSKFVIDDRWLVFAELGYRYSFTDFIDGYTQTQGSKYNDVYYFFSFSVGYRLETSRRGLPGFLDREYKRTKSSSSRSGNRPRNRRQAID